MCTFKVWGGIFFAAFSANAVFAANQIGIDNTLVGQWQGQSDIRPENRANCQSKFRTVSRTPDGRYVISYYSDETRKQKISEVKGRWWSADRTLYMQPPGVTGKPEAYRYYMIDGNTIRFENVEFDIGAPCPDENTQIDNRIVLE